ncbi:DUF2141 domain-containing protein [Leptospira barantonii]|uniref:DUF2141 domain-containing protein n=1 Tax=Leptospira barantonii TaxID=2023184 RepID=A0ABX4NMN1_9LEPT|nr:DUF2141 domain-containing protein [Leptospira barantonii]PJZ58074.1 hypothetical protein CH367_06710 [Leptospira barantonii]
MTLHKTNSTLSTGGPIIENSKQKYSKRILNILFLLFIYSTFHFQTRPILAQTPAGAAPLTVQITGLHNNQGQVLISVYDQSEGFPKKHSKALRSERVKINNGATTIVFSLPPGEYAVAVAHDENTNNELDTNLVGMPKEGVGVSNNVKGFMGPPKYDDAKFKFTATGKTIEIKINYL